jgi:predicted NAD-dependent protein-ADP-ribosyltransferase YbiA (DUF1768 family)
VSKDSFRYFSGSADTAPGAGRGETALAEDYPHLAAIKNWRQILSNFWVGSVPLVYDGRSYRTLEHTYQAMKFRQCGHPDVAAEFTLESGSKLSKGDGLAARRARKRVVLSKAQLRPWVEDDTSAIRIGMYYAKFAQVPEAKKVLLATGSARLIHAGPRVAPVEIAELYMIRDALRLG